MPLPEEWDNVDWRTTVVILPGTTEGVPVFPVSKDKYPQYPRGYFMMATTNSQGQEVVGYNAADVGGSGRQVSEFVFWHELGHHKLGHTKSAKAQHVMEGVEFPQFGPGNETAADIFACEHWAKTGTTYGVRVISETRDYFLKQGNAPGDAEHPAPAARAAHLLKFLQGLQLYKLTIKNDVFTRPTFVKEVLMQCLDLTEPQAWGVIQEIEAKGEYVFFGKGIDRKSRYLTREEAQKLVSFINMKQKFGDPANANFSCVVEPII